MRMFTFAKRCAKEILRDPLNLMFGLGFPIVLLLLLSAIQANVPVKLFEIESLTPGITVFGLSFLTLFSATLIAKDRESSLLQRLYTTPLKSSDYILGYMLPIIPIAIAQGVICYLYDSTHCSFLCCTRAIMRQCVQRQASRWHLRCTSYKSVRVAFRCVV